MPLPGEGGEPPPAGRRNGEKDRLDRFGSSTHTLVQPQQEWLQMYEEAWRLQHEQFWDADLVRHRLAHRARPLCFSGKKMCARVVSCQT